MSEFNIIYATDNTFFFKYSEILPNISKTIKEN
jgi:hypothetical protein